MIKDNKVLLNKKIYKHMDKLLNYFKSISRNPDAYIILNESIFNFNSTGDIAITLHTNYGKKLRSILLK